jgi:hypothetical protein
VAYREPAPEALRDSFWYGPFGNPLPVIGFSLLFVAAAAAATATIRESSVLHCERASGQCVYERSAVIGAKPTIGFAIADVKDVELVTGAGKNRNSAHSVIVLRSNERIPLRTISESEARGRQGRLEYFLKNGQGAEVRETQQSSLLAKIGMVTLALVIGAVVVSLLVIALPFRVRVFERHIEVPRERRSFDITRVQRIIVETWGYKAHPQRIAFLHGDGEVDVIPRTFRPRGSIHGVVATRLGKLLNVPVDLDGQVPDDEPEKEG